MRDSVFLLYYWHRWDEGKELISAFDSMEAAKSRITRLMYMFPVLYDEVSRFYVEQIPIESFEGVITN